MDTHDDDDTPRRPRRRSMGAKRLGPRSQAGATDAAADIGGESSKRREAKQKKRPWNPQAYVLWLLGRREYSRAELTRKLQFKAKEKQLPDLDIEKVLDQIQDLGLQSDSRFVGSRVRQAAAGSRGPGWVKQKLMGHGIDAGDLDAALAEVTPDHWQAQAVDLAQRKYGPAPYTSLVKPKVASLLIRRGYSIGLAWNVAGASGPLDDDT